MKRRKINILCSPILALGILVSLLSLWGFYFFLIIYEPIRISLITKHIPLFIIMTIIGGFAPPICILFVYARKYLSIITIDETGISRRFLWKFYKLHISWDEITEVYYFSAIAQFLVFSKNKKVSVMTYNKMRLEKDTIELTLSKKRYEVIKQYLQQPIINLPEKVKQRMEQEE